jgi:hypothetical protein
VCACIAAHSAHILAIAPAFPAGLASLPLPRPHLLAAAAATARKQESRTVEACCVHPHALCEGPNRRPEGEWMGADKNSSRGRLKLRQDELARSNPRNHTLRTSTFRLPKPRSHWSATGPRSKLYQQPQHTRSNDSGNHSKAG